MREPALDFPDYKSTALRHPKQPLVYLPDQLTETTGPQLGHLRPGAIENDLTRQHDEMPVGERITVSGRLLDTDGRPIRDSLVKIWQANAAGRYRHAGTPGPRRSTRTSPAAAVRDRPGRPLRVLTVKPGPYPGGPRNAWRPAHIHFSLLGRPSSIALSRRCTSPATRCSPHDPIFNAVRDPRAARADDEPLLHSTPSPGNWALDVRVRHRARRPRRNSDRRGLLMDETPSQTVGPYLSLGALLAGRPRRRPRRRAHRRTRARRGRRADRRRAGGGLAPRNPPRLRALPDRRRRPTADRRPLAPHYAIHVLARGLLRDLEHRVSPRGAADDPVLAAVAGDRPRHLLAERAGDGYRFDIRLQRPRDRLLRRLSRHRADALLARPASRGTGARADPLGDLRLCLLRLPPGDGRCDRTGGRARSRRRSRPGRPATLRGRRADDRSCSQ